MESLKVDHAKKLKSEQDASSQLLDDFAAFTERAKESDAAKAKEKSKYVATMKRMNEDATTIKSLKAQLH